MAGSTAGGSIDRLTVRARLAVLCFGVRQAQRESNITFREIWLPNFFCQLPIKRGRKNIQRVSHEISQVLQSYGYKYTRKKDW